MFKLNMVQIDTAVGVKRKGGKKKKTQAKLVSSLTWNSYVKSLLLKR